MKKFILLTLVLALGVSFTLAQTPESYSLNFKVGGLFAGKVNVGGLDIDTKMSPILKADLDGILMPKLSMGGYLLFTPVGIEDLDEKFNTLSLGLTIKPRFALNDGLQLRPGVAIGYTRISNDDVTDDPSSGLNVGFQVELMKAINEKTGIVGEFGFISQPAGGTGDVEVTFTPTIYLMIGIEIFK
jgi:hypothetical protein